MSESLEMNLLKAAILPVSFWTSLTFFGEGIEWMALIVAARFLRVSFDAQWVTMYPRNLPELQMSI